MDARREEGTREGVRSFFPWTVSGVADEQLLSRCLTEESLRVACHPGHNRSGVGRAEGEQGPTGSMAHAGWAHGPAFCVLLAHLLPLVSEMSSKWRLWSCHSGWTEGGRGMRTEQLHGQRLLEPAGDVLQEDTWNVESRVLVQPLLLC